MNKLVDCTKSCIILFQLLRKLISHVTQVYTMGVCVEKLNKHGRHNSYPIQVEAVSKSSLKASASEQLAFEMTK